METPKQSIVGHPQGEQPTVEGRSAIADTFAGRTHVEWDSTSAVAPFGQLLFFVDYRQGDSGLKRLDINRTSGATPARFKMLCESGGGSRRCR